MVLLNSPIQSSFSLLRSKWWAQSISNIRSCSFLSTNLLFQSCLHQRTSSARPRRWTCDRLLQHESNWYLHLYPGRWINHFFFSFWPVIDLFLCPPTYQLPPDCYTSTRNFFKILRVPRILMSFEQLGSFHVYLRSNSKQREFKISYSNSNEGVLFREIPEGWRKLRRSTKQSRYRNIPPYRP